MTTPLISVLVPTLNAAKTLDLALSAVRSQTIPASDVEIIVTDGGSTDDTAAIAKKYGAIVLPNPRVLPAYGMSIGLQNARGRYGVLLGADEVMLLASSFERKIAMMQREPRVHSIIATGLLVPPGYAKITDYVNRYGDPFSLFMYRVDGGDQWTSLRRKYRTIAEDSDSCVIAIDEGKPLPLCDGGAHFFRLEQLRQVADLSDSTVIVRLFDLLAAKHRLIGVLRDDYIHHYSSASLRVARAKIKTRILANVYQSTGGISQHGSRDKAQPLGFRLKKYFYIPYSLSVVGPLVDAVSLSIRHKNPALMCHLPLAVETGVQILKHKAKEALGGHADVTRYG
jgi:glycosyltransferase involved in cell wall biosynthesis